MIFDGNKHVRLQHSDQCNPRTIIDLNKMDARVHEIAVQTNLPCAVGQDLSVNSLPNKQLITDLRQQVSQLLFCRNRLSVADIHSILFFLKPILWRAPRLGLTESKCCRLDGCCTRWY